MPLVKAIERGIEQTESLWETLGRCGAISLLLGRVSRSRLERRAIEGDSPLDEGRYGDFLNSRVA